MKMIWLDIQHYLTIISKKIAIITQSTAKLLIFVLLIVSLAKKGEREREREREFAPKDRISGFSM
jgi:hypothetical protein